jgi:hypothetical protein
VGEICDECGNLTERLLGSESTVRWQAERIRTLETALRDTRCCLHVQGHWDCAVTHARARADLAPVAEQPQPAIPHMLLVLTHKQTTGGCARCGKDWPCPDAPQPAKASTEPPDHV